MKKISWVLCILGWVVSFGVILRRITAFLDRHRRDTFTGEGTLLVFGNGVTKGVVAGSTKTFPHLENQRKEYRPS